MERSTSRHRYRSVVSSVTALGSGWRQRLRTILDFITCVWFAAMVVGYVLLELGKLARLLWHNAAAVWGLLEFHYLIDLASYGIGVVCVSGIGWMVVYLLLVRDFLIE